MTTLHWSWGLSTALILTLVIWLNAHQVRAGWLLGATVQLINCGFGLAYGQWTFAFLLAPAAMFVFIYFRHPRYVKPGPLITPVEDKQNEWSRTCSSKSPDGRHTCQRADMAHGLDPEFYHYALVDLYGENLDYIGWTTTEEWEGGEGAGLRQGPVSV